jgi:hypothetical protein
MGKRGLVLGIAAAVVLVAAGVAYALSSADFQPRASAWQSKECTQALLNSKETAATNQKIALCYALAKLQDHSGALSSLQSEVAALQKQAPVDYPFFNGASAPGGTPLVFDAKAYTKVVFTASCALENVTFDVEVSTNETTWVRQRSFECWSAPADPFGTAARYYRIAITGPGGSQTVRLYARFSN